ncbi:MAG: GNAT family N-acetyltransferase, partial [Bacteroidota bacterium]
LDDCIDNADNGLIYAYSFYLDNMAPHWDALVLNDYDAVIPLVWKKKFSIKYCYQPPFTQQLGLFGNIKDEELKILFTKITAIVKYGDWLFNHHNKFIGLFYPVIPMTNLVINLEDGYDNIHRRYKKDLLDNLKRAEKSGISYEAGNDINKTVDLYRSHYANRTAHVKNKDYKNFNSLCLQAGQNNNCLIREVKDNNGNLLASALLLKDKRRIYNMMNTTTEEGRKKEANHFLLDHIIQEFSGQQFLFDFEGSDISSIKKFYEKFGAFDQPYYHWHYNDLPFYLKWIKK